MAKSLLTGLYLPGDPRFKPEVEKMDQCLLSLDFLLLPLLLLLDPIALDIIPSQPQEILSLYPWNFLPQS